MNTEPLALDIDPKAYLAVHELLDEPAADAALTVRELEVRAKTRELVSREIAPRAALLDHTHQFAHEGVQALTRAGLGGLVFPEHLGGTGDTNVAYAIAMEEISAGCAATSLVFMTQMHAAYPILMAGTDAFDALPFEPVQPGVVAAQVVGGAVEAGVLQPELDVLRRVQHLALHDPRVDFRGS